MSYAIIYKVHSQIPHRNLFKIQLHISRNGINALTANFAVNCLTASNLPLTRNLASFQISIFYVVFTCSYQRGTARARVYS